MEQASLGTVGTMGIGSVRDVSAEMRIRLCKGWIKQEAGLDSL